MQDFFATVCFNLNFQDNIDGPANYEYSDFFEEKKSKKKKHRIEEDDEEPKKRKK